MRRWWLAVLVFGGVCLGTRERAEAGWMAEGERKTRERLRLEKPNREGGCSEEGEAGGRWSRAWDEDFLERKGERE